jgi:hypothetical protein
MTRLLSGLKIGISLSEAEDMIDIGFRNTDMAPFVVTLARRLISLGAAVVLGHQWRPNGIMDSIVQFAELYRSEEGQPRSPILYGFLAAPDTAQISAGDREKLKPLLELRDSVEAPSPDRPPDFQDQRRLNLAFMRSRMADLCDARICLGGKLAQRSHRTHGVIEEAACAFDRRRPVYLCGLLKGSTGLLIEMLQGRIYLEEAIDRLSRQAGERGQTPCNRFTTDYLKEMKAHGEEWCATNAGLGIEAQRSLFEAQSIDTILSIVVPALARVGLADYRV